MTVNHPHPAAIEKPGSLPDNPKREFLMFGSDFSWILRLIFVIVQALINMDPKEGNAKLNGKKEGK